MNARIFIATLGIFITLIVLTYGCSADRSYRDEYINLLEEKLSNQSPVPAEATIVEELSDEEVRTQTFDLLSFACGNTPSVSDVRVRKSAKDQWSVIVVIATDSIDPYGFEVYDKVFLSGTANGDIIEFKNVEALIERCE